MKLVYHDGTVGAIYFPVGKLKKGGTCQFATARCIKACGLETNKAVDDVYKFFQSKPVGIICEQILKDLYYFPRKVLYWFASGDCPSKLEDKIILIMKALLTQGISQNGFTRNKSLWEKALKLNKIRLALTIESKEEALKIKTKGLIAVPNWACWKADIYEWVKKEKKTYHHGGCGGGWYTYKTKEGREKVSVEDCGICHDKKIGCFTNLKK